MDLSKVIVITTGIVLGFATLVGGITITTIHSDQMQTDQKVACAEAGGEFSDIDNSIQCDMP